MPAPRKYPNELRERARRLGEPIGARPVTTVAQSCGRPIHTPCLRVLRRPLESAQYTSIRYTQRLLDAGLRASVGSVGDSYDNALAESLIGLYKAELVYWDGPWKGADDLEL